jgi:hypothetical protein
MAVDGKKADAERMRTGNVAFLLDGVAEGDAGSRCTGVERHFDFGDGRAIEVGAHVGEQLQHFRSRICLHGIVDGAVRHGLTERGEVVTHDVEVDHEAGTIGTSGCEKVADALSGHINPFSNSRAPGKPEDKGPPFTRLGTSRWRPRNLSKRLDSADDGSTPRERH